VEKEQSKKSPKFKPRRGDVWDITGPLDGPQTCQGKERPREARQSQLVSFCARRVYNALRSSEPRPPQGRADRVKKSRSEGSPRDSRPESRA